MILYYCNALRVIEHLFCNPVFANCIDYTPYRLLDKDGLPVRGEFMSGEFAWNYMVCVYFVVSSGD